MKTDLACLPCFFRQVSRTLSYAGVNGARGREITQAAADIIEQASLEQAPARISTLLHRLIRKTAGTDPYRAVKEEYTRIALATLPAARVLAAGHGPDALAGGVRAAIAGNIIDFGIYDSVDLDRSLQDSFRQPLSEPAFQAFSRAVDRARNILFLCDNAGEIVFDRILIEELSRRGKTVTAVVKGIPVINDATMDDAIASGLRESASAVIDNGNDGIGTLLELCSETFRAAYDAADLIVSKGQANFETLATVDDDRIFYFFKVKCPVVARALGRENGDIVLMGNREVRR
ncbi:MAG: ARMT1-like domain-containing protein [Nitrospiraceae bacterium]|nr:ARMT1-like domain-containing protein [Nitrospiraceae bacterium]